MADRTCHFHNIRHSQREVAAPATLDEHNNSIPGKTIAAASEF